MSELHLKLDSNLITLEDTLRAESKEFTWPWVARLLARMAIDDQGKPMEYDDAIAIIGKLTLAEASEWLNRLLETQTVPKVSE